MRGEKVPKIFNVSSSKRIINAWFRKNVAKEPVTVTNLSESPLQSPQVNVNDLP
jgi:hypothetical protein